MAVTLCDFSKKKEKRKKQRIRNKKEGKEKEEKKKSVSKHVVFHACIPPNCFQADLLLDFCFPVRWYVVMKVSCLDLSTFSFFFFFF